MKRSFISFGLLVAAAFALTNCAKEESFAPVQEEAGAATPFQVVANIATDTKTYNDGMDTKWSENDQIKLAFTVATGQTIEVTNPLTTKGDGVFTGTIDWTSILGGLNSAFKVSDIYVTYPYNAGAENLVPKTTTQTGYNSMAHLARANCPLYGSVNISDFEYSILNFTQATLPEIKMYHTTSVAEVNITNDSGEPLVINSVSVGESTGDIEGTVPTIVREIKGTTLVAEATEIPHGETVKVYVIVEPFTVAPSEETAKLMFWVNDTPKEVVVEKDITFTAGKIKKVNFTYKGDFPELYAVADVRKEMLVERIVPSINTLVDLEFVKQWVSDLKNHEDIAGLLSGAAMNIVAGDFDSAYYALNGIPGFEYQTEVVVGNGRYIRRVSYKAADYLAQYLKSINDVSSIEELLGVLETVESYYEITGLKETVSTGMGTVLDYMTELRKNVEEYLLSILDKLGIVNKPVEPSRDDYSSSIKYAAAYAAYLKDLAVYESAFATYNAAVELFEGKLRELTDLSIVDLVQRATENEYAEMIVNWMFENSTIRQTLVQYVIDAIAKIEFDIEADNELLKKYAMEEALMQANILANQDVQANFEQLNQDEIDQLNNTPWGLFRLVLDWDKTYEFFQEYQLTEVYATLQTIAKTVEDIVVYDEVNTTIAEQTCELYAPTEIPQN